jgi:NAD+ synthase
MDLALYARINDYPADSLAAAMDVSVDDANRIYADIDAKRRVAEVLHLPALVQDPGSA